MIQKYPVSYLLLGAMTELVFEFAMVNELVSTTFSGRMKISLNLFVVIYAICIVEGKNKPHIIFILADDMGWNDVGFHGMTDIPTPNIDAMAANSVILNNHYSHSLCTPSRAALLTGKYPFTIGMHHGVILNGEPYGLPLNLKILPEYLNEQGYDSHIVGKWHLGHFRRQYTPTYRGFQTHYGFWNGGVDFFTQETFAFPYSFFNKNCSSKIEKDDILMAGKDLVYQMRPQHNRKREYLTRLLTRRAKRIILRHDQKRPLFLFLAHHAVHRGNLFAPLRGPPEETKMFQHFQDIGKINFAGSLTSLDNSLGSIFEALESQEMLQNSLIAFVSDNGAPVTSVTWNGASNWPLRGEKGSPYEGAVRTVAMVWSPRLEGRISQGLFHITDWLPTIYRLAGGNPSTLTSIEGMDQWDLLRNEKSSRTELVVTIEPDPTLSAIRDLRYKLINWQHNDTYHKQDEDSRRSANSSRVQTSKVQRVLRRFYKAQGKEVKHTKKPVIEITCRGEETKDRPQSGLMLFDLVDDPCEERNVADFYPKVVSQLQERLDYWNKKVAPPLKKKTDMRSDPSLFGGRWTPWCDNDQLTGQLAGL